MASKIVVVKAEATDYSLARPVNQKLPLKPAAYAKRKISKSRYAKEMQVQFEKEANITFQFDLEKEKKSKQKTITYEKACDSKKCECVAMSDDFVEGKIKTVNDTCLYTAKTGQLFVVYGKVQYRLDTIVSNCQLKVDALYANFNELDTDITIGPKDGFQIISEIQLNEDLDVD
jgi:hypothetical protein